MRNGYLLTSDCTWFTSSANAYQKLRLVTQAYDAMILLPDGCASWVHPEFQSGIKTYAWPHCLRKGVPGKVFLAFQLLSAFWKFRREVDRWFVPPSNELSFLACWLAECFSKKPFVLFCWDPPGVSVRDRQDVISRIRCKLMDFLMGRAVRRCQIMVLNLHPDFLVGRFPPSVRSKIVSFANGTLVDVNAEAVRGCERVRHRIAVNSKFEAAKGCHEMARLFVGIRSEFPDASLVWTGDGCDREEVLSRLREAGIPSTAIIAPGRIPQREALRLLATGQVAVNCYENVPSLRWNYVLKIPEFQSIGVPVVTVDLPGAREYVESGRNGVLFAPGDWLAARNELVKLLKDEKRCRHFADVAFEDVQEYDWRKVNAAIETKINESGLIWRSNA